MTNALCKEGEGGALNYVDCRYGTVCCVVAVVVVDM